MKKELLNLFILFGMLLTSVGTWGATNTVGQTFDSGNLTYTIITTGSTSSSGTPGTVSVTLKSGVTKTSITSLTIPGMVSMTPTGASGVSIYFKVTKILSNAFSSCTNLETVTFGSSTTNYWANITEIESGAFSSCNKIATVNYYNTLDKWCGIDFKASSSNPLNGSSVTTKVFKYGTSSTLTTLSSPTFNVTTIKPYAFYRFTNIKNVTFGANVKSIGSNAFYYCTGIQSVKMGTSTTAKSGIEEIGSSAFSNCTGVTSVYFYGSLTDWLGISFAASSNPMNSAKAALYFNGTAASNKVTSLDITGVSNIGNYAFNGCQSLTSVTIGEGVQSIGTSAFASCKALETVTLPSTIESVGNSAFTSTGLGNTGNLYYNGTIEDWVLINFGNAAANPANFATQLRIDGDIVTSVYLPDEVTTIKNYVFYGNKALQDVSLNANTVVATDAFTNSSAVVTFRGTTGGATTDGLSWSYEDGVIMIFGEGEMKDYSSSNPAPWSTFRNSVHTIVVEEGVRKIGKYAFQNFDRTTQISLPASLEIIENYAMSGMSDLTRIYCVALSVPAVIDAQSGPSSYTSYAFSNVPTDCEVLVPGSLIDAYKAAGTSSHNTNTGWKRFSNYSAFGTCGDDLMWVYNESAQTLVISGTGAMSTYASAADVPWNAYRATITSVTLPEEITSIGAYAFQNTKITSVVIPAGVTEIGNYAFNSCSALTTITCNATTPATAKAQSFTSLPYNAYAYVPANLDMYKAAIGWNQIGAAGSRIVLMSSGQDDNIKWSVDPATGVLYISHDGATTMKDYTAGATPWYAYKDVITKIAISPNLTTIGAYAFYGLDKATVAHFYMAAGTPPTESYLTAIGAHAFDGCTSLRTVGNTGFYGSWPSNAVALPKKLVTIGESAFDGCDLTGALTIATPVTTIGANAFRGNGQIESVSMGGNITSMGASAFDGCEGLIMVSAVSLEKWLGISFANETANPLYYGHELKYGGVGATDCVVPAGVTVVKPYTFINCTSMQSLNVHPTVTSIGAKAFYGCENFKHIVSQQSTPCNVAADAFVGVPAGIPVYVPTKADEATYAAAHEVAATEGWRADFQYLEGKPSGVCGDNLTWVYDVMQATLTISGTGDMYDWPNPEERPWREYSAAALVVDYAFDCTVTSIGENAFMYFTNLMCPIYIPETVTKIGANAYTNCKNTGATLNIPAAVQEIGASAFKNHKEIETIYFGDNEHDSQLQTVGADAFRDMANYAAGGLNSVYYYGTMADWANIDFANFYSTPMQNWSESHPVSFFYNGAKLTSITIEPGTTAIKPQVFYNMKDVTGALTIPSTVTSIGERAFNGTAITSVTIGDEEHGSELTSIGSFAFGSVKTLTDVTVYAIPAPVNASTSNFDSKAYENATLHIPAMAKKSYVNEATWQRFQHIVTFGKAALSLSDDADNSEDLEFYDGETVDVQLTRTLKADMYNTICLPFALDADQVTETFGAGTDIAAPTSSSLSGDEFTVVFAQGITTIAAGVPYLIKPTKAVVDPSFEDVTIDATIRNTSTEYVDFIGQTSKTWLAADSYIRLVGADNVLYTPSAAGNLKGMRAYFMLNPSVPVSARGRIVWHENTSTGVENVNDDADVNCVRKVLRNGQVVILRGDKAYNLQGVAVESL